MHTVEETAEEHENHNNSIMKTKIELHAAMEPIKDEDEDAYRDTLFGQNKEQANPNYVNNSTIFFK